MRRKNAVPAFFLLILTWPLFACNSLDRDPFPTPTPVSTRISTSTATSTVTQTSTPSLTATPTLTLTNTPSPTLTPTEIGGGTARLIFLKAENSTSMGGSLYTIHLDETDLIQIPLVADEVFNFYLSPAGDKILFKSSTGIYSVDASGANERLLFEGEDYYLDGWFLDGKDFLMDKGNRELFKVNIETLELTTIMTGFTSWYTLSPDGTKIVYENNHSIYLMNANGSDQHRIANIYGFGFYWSPDSSRIIFCACSPTVTNLGLVNADGTGQRILVTNAFGVGWMNESVILFHRVSESKVYNLSRIDVDGSNQGDLIIVDKLSYRPMAFSPDGKKIAFLGNCSRNSMCDIFTMNFDGTDVVNTTNSPGFYRIVVWQP